MSIVIIIESILIDKNIFHKNSRNGEIRWGHKAPANWLLFGWALVQPSVCNNIHKKLQWTIHVSTANGLSCFYKENHIWYSQNCKQQGNHKIPLPLIFCSNTKLHVSPSIWLSLAWVKIVGIGLSIERFLISFPIYLHFTYFMLQIYTPKILSKPIRSGCIMTCKWTKIMALGLLEAWLSWLCLYASPKEHSCVVSRLLSSLLLLFSLFLYMYYLLLCVFLYLSIIMLYQDGNRLYTILSL